MTVKSCEKVWSRADESDDSIMEVIHTCLGTHTEQSVPWITPEGLQRTLASLRP